MDDLTMSPMQHFFLSCFHQDWMQDYGSVDTAVLHYKKNNDARTVSHIAGELARVLAEDGQPVGILDAYDASVVPAGLGMSEGQLLAKLLDLLRNDAL